MSLLGVIQQSAGALNAAQIGLQVVGNNIANANTPGYIRQELLQASAVATRDGGLIKGMGVRPIGVTQVIDNAIAERMLAANTDVSGAETLETAYSQLEEITNELGNSGLNNQLTQFNNAIHELSAQPGDESLRDFVIIQGETLASNIQSVRERAVERRELWNGDIADIASDINRLTGRIAKLNLDIATMEGGGLIHSDATGLRDQRLADLQSLSEYVSINVQEQESGTVAVFVGGDFLISNGIAREVYATYSEEAGGQEIRIRDSQAVLESAGGKLAATVAAREDVFGEFIDELDSMASSLIRGFNEIHAQGQGSKAYESITGTIKTVAGVPLRNADLAFEPKNGSFDIRLVDLEGEPLGVHRIDVRMLNQIDDSTVNSIAAQINAIDGLESHVTSEGRLEINSTSPTSRFTFADDTSSFLAAAGINTFFTGEDALDIAINETLKDDNGFLAVSAGGINADTDVLTQMIDMVDTPLAHSTKSVRDQYEQTISRLAQEINLQKSSSEGLRNFAATLEAQHLAVTGVNIDEESIKMIGYQRSFQAASRVIVTANEMLELLTTL